MELRTCYHVALLSLASVLGACTVDTERAVGTPAVSALTSASQETSQTKDGLVHWETLADDSLWAIIARSDSVVDVGLKLPGTNHGMDHGRVLLQGTARDGAVAQVAAIAGSKVLDVDAKLPIARVRVPSVYALGLLRRSPWVSYVDPGYFIETSETGLWSSGDSGCSVAAYSGPANTTITPGDVLPWNYSYMNIPLAWNKVGGGAGTIVGIVDTGVDAYQAELNGNFSSGMSLGRTFLKSATSNSNDPTSWNDDCGHGTRMASVVGAPRNGQGMLGVAWGANLYAVRVDNDVMLTNVAATRLGIDSAATHAKIVTMAFGTAGYYNSIADVISYWYNYDRLFVAAAGTSFCGDPLQSTVTFPGNLTTVTTVTALDQTGAIACNAHYGSAVDFAAYASQPAVGYHSLGSTLAGIAGSSNATAVIAGLAALNLSTHPSATRSAILADLIVSASPTGYLSPTIGWGVPNALCVVKGLCFAFINGPSLIQTLGTRTYTWTVGQVNSPGPFTYLWSTGETTNTITRSISVWSGMTEYELSLSVTITDLSTGTTTNPVLKTVLVRDPQGCPTCT